MRHRKTIFTLLAIVITNSTLIADPNSSNWAWVSQLKTAINPFLGTIFRKTAEYSAESYHCVLQNPVKSAVIALLSTTTGLWGAYRLGRKSGYNVGREAGSRERKQQKKTLQEYMADRKKARQLAPGVATVQRPQAYISVRENNIYWDGYNAAQKAHSAHWDDARANQRLAKLRENMLTVNNHLTKDLAFSKNNALHLGYMLAKEYQKFSHSIDEDTMAQMQKIHDASINQGIYFGFSLATHSAGKYSQADVVGLDCINSCNDILTLGDPQKIARRIEANISDWCEWQRNAFEYIRENPDATLDATQQHFNVTQHTIELEDGSHHE